MDQKVFVEEMNRLATVFKNIIDPGRIKRYYEKVQDIPNEAFSAIVNHYLDTFKNQPLPMDFEKSAKEWKKDFYEKNGYFFSSSLNQATAYEYLLCCKNCYDSGFVFMAVNIDQVMSNEWAYCDCASGEKKATEAIYELPRLDHEMKHLFTVKEFPTEYFVPSITSSDNVKSLWSKVTAFKASLKKSEIFWSGK